MLRRMWVAATIVALGLGGIASRGLADAPPDTATMPVAQVRPGMTGYGLTVIHGTAIQRFGINVMGILHNSGGSDLVLFRANGPVIQSAGGTAAGMSGSPIYIDGRLVGALSYGYQFAGPDSDLSLATPIAEMLKILPKAHAAASRAPRLYRAPRPIPTAAGPISEVLVMPSYADAAAYNAHPLPGLAALAPAAVPMFASGFSPAGFRLLSRFFRRFDVMPRQGYGGSRVFQAPPLQPGSSLGVELVRGDAEVGAIGTVTYRRGDQILAFGHPFLNAGPSAMMLTTAYIDTVVRALNFPFKEGSIGTIAGTIDEDRTAGIAGTVGQFPRTFGVRVAVHDDQAGTTRTFGAQVLRRPDLAEGLVPMTALSLVQRALDRVAGGSAEVRIALRAKAVPRPIVRQDLAYDIGDIATASVLDVPGATQLLFGNFFEATDPIDMTITMTVGVRNNTALLVEARPDRRVVHPGDTVRVAVAVRPYGEPDPVGHVAEFTVPRDFPTGPAFLLVGTAGTLNNSNGASPSDQFQALVQQEGTPLQAASLNDAIDQFEHFGKNTDLLVELVPEAVLAAVGSNANPGFESPAGAVLPTDWVVLGRFQIPMTVQ